MSKSLLDQRFDDDPLVRYKWFDNGTPYTNKGEYFVVLVGVNFTRTFVDNTALVQVADSAGNVIDAVITALTTVTAVGEEFEVQFLPRRMLIPPGGVLTINGGSFASMVSCRTLTDAMLAL